MELATFRTPSAPSPPDDNRLHEKDLLLRRDAQTFRRRDAPGDRSALAPLRQAPRREATTLSPETDFGRCRALLRRLRVRNLARCCLPASS